MKKLALTMAMLLSAGSAWAGGTSMKISVVPVVDVCDSDHCLYNVGVTCTTNTECNFGSNSPKSSFQATGTGSVKVQLKDVTDGAGAPASGNYQLFVGLIDQLAAMTLFLPIEVVVNYGKGKAAADIGTLLPPAGDLIEYSFSALLTPPAVPADCPSGNDPEDIVARIYDYDCMSLDSRLVGQIGIVSGS